MKVWVVYFRGEPEFASPIYKEAQERAAELLMNMGGPVQIRKEEV